MTTSTILGTEDLIDERQKDLTAPGIRYIVVHSKNDSAFDDSDLITAAWLNLHGNYASDTGFLKPIIALPEKNESLRDSTIADHELLGLANFMSSRRFMPVSNISHQVRDPDLWFEDDDLMPGFLRVPAVGKKLEDFDWRASWRLNPDAVEMYKTDFDATEFPLFGHDSLYAPPLPWTPSLSNAAAANDEVYVATDPVEAVWQLLGVSQRRSTKRSEAAPKTEQIPEAERVNLRSTGPVKKVSERVLAETRFVLNTFLEAIFHPLSTSVLDKRTGKVVERW